MAFTQPKIGLGTKIGFAGEAVWGTGVAASTHALDPRGGMESLVGEVDTFRPESLSFRGGDPTQFVQGERRVSGNITHDLRFGGGWMLFLSHLTGHLPVDAGSDPYTHTLQLGRDLSGGTTVTDEGVSIHVDRGGQHSAAAEKEWYYTGCRPTSVDFTFAPNSIATASWEFIGKDVTMQAAQTQTLSTVEYVQHPSRATSPTSAIKYGTDGSETANTSVTAMSLHIEMPWERLRNIDNQTGLEPMANGQMIITGSFEIDAPVATSTFGVLGAAYRDATTNSLLMTVDGADASTAKMLFDFPKVRITSTGEAPAADAGRITQTVEWEAHYSGTAGTGMGTFTLTNEEALSHVASA